ncbi:MAG: hypothetical protein ACXWQO_12525 [Bdellovibrionota bacterium]
MAILTIIVGGSGFFLCALAPERMDLICRRYALLLVAKWKLLLSQSTATEPDLLICSRLLAALRAGISLDSALNLISKEAECTSAVRERIVRITDGFPPPDFLSTYLASALRSGMPVLSTLQLFQQVLSARRKLQLRSQSLTGQARAQAEVLAWLPWALAGMIFLMDPEWFHLASHQSFSWFLWSLAIGLTGLGKKWMKRSVRRALEPNSPTEALEEKELPELALQMVAELSMGTDADTALERSLAAIGAPEFSRYFFGKDIPPEKVQQLKSLLRHAALTGAPLRDDLLSFLQSLYVEIESRWEERIQRLPVSLLLPLFVCFFPGTLLVIVSLLIPLLKELQ